MRSQKIAITILWVLIVAFVVWKADAILSATAEVLAALIAGTVTIGGAILTHALQKEAEQHRLQQEKQQENYAQLIASLDEAIRRGDDPSDEFAKTHLASWVYGSPAVIQSTKGLLLAKDPKSKSEELKKLLCAMRRDIGLSLPPDHFEIEGIFKARKDGSLE